VFVFVVYEGVPNVPSCFKNSPLEPAAGTKFPLPVPIKVLVSAAVLLTSAPASIPSNLEWSSVVKFSSVCDVTENLMNLQYHHK